MKNLNECFTLIVARMTNMDLTLKIIASHQCRDLHSPQQNPDSSDEQSHLLHSSTENQRAPGLSAQPPSLHIAHPWLQSLTWRELLRTTPPSLARFQRIMRLHIGRKSTILQSDAQRTIYFSTSEKPRNLSLSLEKRRTRHEPLSTSMELRGSRWKVLTVFLNQT